MIHQSSFAIAIAAALVTTGAAAQVPEPIAAPGESAIVTLHAEGAQIYDCKAGADGKLAWAFREPIATLLVTARRGSGVLSGATTVQRINTAGGVMSGACDKAGAFRSAPYAAEYVFLRKGS